MWVQVPPPAPKRPLGLFLLVGLCALHNKRVAFGTHTCVAGARLRKSVSGVKLSLDCTSHHPHQKDSLGLFLLVGLCALHNKRVAFGTHTCVAGARLRKSVSGVKLSLDCTSHHQHQKDLNGLFCLVGLYSNNIRKLFKFSQYMLSL